MKKTVGIKDLSHEFMGQKRGSEREPKRPNGRFFDDDLKLAS
jgi:hypothetical protein